jgi:hypothetical protein
VAALEAAIQLPRVRAANDSSQISEGTNGSQMGCRVKPGNGERGNRVNSIRDAINFSTHAKLSKTPAFVRSLARISGKPVACSSDIMAQTPQAGASAKPHIVD